MVAKSRTEYICLMTNGVDIIDGGLLPLNDGDTGDALHHPSKIMEVRPAFMEPLPPGGPPPNGGNYVRLVGGVGSVVGGRGGVGDGRGSVVGGRGGVGDGRGGVGDGRGAVRIRRSSSSSSSSSFPIKDDAGYIGYLSDDESGGDASDVMMKALNRRRRELMGSDMSFSGCMFMMIAVGGLLLLFLWGVRPPTAGSYAL